VHTLVSRRGTGRHGSGPCAISLSQNLLLLLLLLLHGPLLCVIRRERGHCRIRLFVRQSLPDLRHLDQNRPPYTVWKCVRDVETLSRKATIALAWSFIVRCHSTASLLFARRPDC